MSFQYTKIGHSNKVLLLFHGFGQNSERFLPFVSFLQSHYTLYLIDWLPEALQQESISPKEVAQQFEVFCESKQLEKVSLLGFSLGARWVLALVNESAHLLDEVLLIAPDGISTHWSFDWATQSTLGKTAFKWLTQSPKTLQNLLKVYTFFQPQQQNSLQQASKEENLSQLYKTWQWCKQLHFSNKLLKEKIEQNEIKVYFWIALKDELIDNKAIQYFVRTLPNTQTQLFEFPCNHWQILKAFKKHYASHFL